MNEESKTDTCNSASKLTDTDTCNSDSGSAKKLETCEKKGGVLDPSS